MNLGLLKFILRLVLFVVKTGQLNNALRLAAWAIKTKMDYDEAMDRLTGVYYERQVARAANNYKARHPDDFKCDTSGVPGFDRWKKEQGS